MSTFTNLPASQLRRAAKLKDKIAKLTKEIEAIFDGSSPDQPRRQRQMSAAGRAAIVAGQKKRWAKIKARKPAK